MRLSLPEESIMVTAKKATTTGTQVPAKRVAAKSAVAKPVAAKPVVTKAAATKSAPATRKPATKVATPPVAPVAAAKKPATVKKATAPKKSPAAKPALSPEQRNHYVEVAAFYIAERRGFALADPAQDWAAAETEIDRLIASGHFSG
jgi:hypothetical protein